MRIALFFGAAFLGAAVPGIILYFVGVWRWGWGWLAKAHRDMYVGNKRRPETGGPSNASRYNAGQEAAWRD